MIDTPEIALTEPWRTAVVRINVPPSEIHLVMGPAIGEVMATLAAQGVAPAGAVFSHHLRMDPDVFDFEVGVPVAGAFQPSGRVVEGRLPEVKAARTVYHGPYEGLGAAWGEFQAWMVSRELEPTGCLWESYLSGPERDPDPATWRTELVQPLQG